jgi:hypothetical protein
VTNCLAILLTLLQGPTTPVSDKPPASDSKPAPGPGQEAELKEARTQLNLLGQTDSKSGESRRNENVQFNLIDNNALKEINQRLGASATFVPEFSSERNYFGAEFGTAPTASILTPATVRPAWHGSLQWTHSNSRTSARSFFQVGDVPPARENEGVVQASGPVWKGASFSFDGTLQRVRGIVNGNILVPLPSERTPLATNPAVRALVSRILDAYPKQAPNRLDIDPRMLNTNSVQSIDNQNTTSRVDQRLGSKDQLVAAHTWIAQKVIAFQLLQGQNPDTTTRSHRAGFTWNRAQSARTLISAGFRFDRTGSIIVPERNNFGPQVFASGVLTPINAQNAIPIDRAQNLFKTAAQVRRSTGAGHQLSFGFEIVRRQMNGRESDAHLGAIQFSNAFGNDAITNLRLGLPITYFLGIGQLHRGFRNWDNWFYFGDKWQVSQKLTLQVNAGYRPVTRPVEVNGLNRLPYFSDHNNLGPSLGLAYRTSLGVIRAAYGIHFGEVFPVTFQQIRFNPPLNTKLVIQNPDILNPRSGATAANSGRFVFYDFDPKLVSPYAQQYNLIWEVEPRKGWKLQNGYIGSRSLKLLQHWYQNRAHPVAGTPLTVATIDDRRLSSKYTEVRKVTNGSRAYFDAFRTTLVIPQAKGWNVDVSYWLSKAIDLGADYTSTANDVDSFRFRSQYEYESHADLRGLARFDSPHAFLARVNYALPAWKPRVAGRWSVNTVSLIKTGTPFGISTGSDAPGFGNVDGISGDRPNVLDPSVLGRTIGHPDESRQLLPRSAFGFVETGARRGNIGRNVFRRGPIRNVNASVSGQWRVWKERTLLLRMESNNLTNTAQFAEPGFNLTDPNFGVITNTLNDGRSFRFVLRLGF